MYNRAMVALGQEPWYEQTAQIVFYLTPLIVFIVTGLVAAWRFNIFRMAKPAIKIDLEVTSYKSSDSWNVLNAVGLVTNTSKVRAGCDSLQWEVRVLAPYDDDDVRSKVAQYESYMIAEGRPADFPWNVQYRIRNDNPGIDLEPGESNLVDISLAIPNWITAVDIRCTMVLPKGKGGPDYVWTSLCTHDIHWKVMNGE